MAQVITGSGTQITTQMTIPVAGETASITYLRDNTLFPVVNSLFAIKGLVAGISSSIRTDVTNTGQLILSASTEAELVTDTSIASDDFSVINITGTNANISVEGFSDANAIPEGKFLLLTNLDTTANYVRLEHEIDALDERLSLPEGIDIKMMGGGSTALFRHDGDFFRFIAGEGCFPSTARITAAGTGSIDVVTTRKWTSLIKLGSTPGGKLNSIGPANYNGKMMYVYNSTTGSFAIGHNSGSVAAYGIGCPGDVDMTLPPKSGIMLQYDDTDDFLWRVQGSNNDSYATLSYNLTTAGAQVYVNPRYRAVEVTPDAGSRTIRNIYPVWHGRELIVTNTSSTTYTLKHLFGGTANQRLALPGAVDLSMTTYKAVRLRYSENLNGGGGAWQVLGS